MNASLLSSPARSGVFRKPKAGLEKLVAAAAKIHFPVLEAELTTHRSSRAVLQELGRSLHFPEWYGTNFDALHDCLCDPEWQPAKGHLLILGGLDSLRAAHPADFLTLIEVLRSASDIRRESGTAFWILADSQSHEIADLPDA